MRPWAELGRLALLALALVACDEAEEETYVQFNADDEQLTVEVGASELGEAESIDLHSTTGEVLIGTATVDPSAGPIGTEHALVVEILDAYEHMVDRVSVRTDSGERGEDEYDLVPDSADEGFFKLVIVSVGAEGEQRSDTLTILVWDVEGDDDGESSGSDPEDTADTADSGG